MRPTKSKGWGGTEEGPRKARDLAGDECARGGRSDMLAKHHTAAADACMVLEVVSALQELASTGAMPRRVAVDMLR